MKLGILGSVGNELAKYIGICRYRTVENFKNIDFLHNELRIATMLIITGRSSSCRIYAATNETSRLAVFMRVYSGFSKK